MTVKDELHALVDGLDEDGAEEALDCLRWLAAESDSLTDEELERVREGEEQIARSGYVTVDEVRQRLGI